MPEKLTGIQAKEKRRRYNKYFRKNLPNAISIRFFHKAKDVTNFAGQKGISESYSRDVIAKALFSSSPFAAIRIGGGELGALNNYEKIRLGKAKTYKELNFFRMKVESGWFPATEKMLDRFGELSLAAFADADLLGVCGYHMEDYFAHEYCPKATYIRNTMLEPLLGGWTPLLANKKVLIISSYSKEVEVQYGRREKIFPENEELLPKFASLVTLDAPLTLGDETIEGSDSEKELVALEKKIDEIDFDIALIGAGAYGSLLALHCKKIGKQAMQLGGSLMTLFGIIGHRYENRDYVKRYINKDWIRPYNKPRGYEKIEQGAYW